MTDKKTKVRTDPNIDLNTLGDNELLEQLREKQTKDFDDLVAKYNSLQEKLEGAETQNAYFQDEITELKKAIKVLNDALVIKANPQKRLWVKFDTSNVELTRPLFNIMLRNKDRPKQFFIEVMGDDVVEISETKL